MDTISVVWYTCTSLANTECVRSQLGFVVTPADKHSRWNTFHYSSAKCLVVTRSVMAAERNHLVLRFDHTVVVRDMVSHLLNLEILLEASVDSKTVFEVLDMQEKTFQ